MKEKYDCYIYYIWIRPGCYIFLRINEGVWAILQKPFAEQQSFSWEHFFSAVEGNHTMKLAAPFSYPRNIMTAFLTSIWTEQIANINFFLSRWRKAFLNFWQTLMWAAPSGVKFRYNSCSKFVCSTLSVKWASYYILRSVCQRCNSLWPRKFILQPLRRYDVKPKKPHKCSLTFEEPCLEKSINSTGAPSSDFRVPSLALYCCATLTLGKCAIIEIHI